MKTLNKFLRIAIVVNVFALILQIGCATVGKPILTKLDHVVDCTVDTVKHQLPDLIDSVATALLDKDYLGALTSLARQFGDDAVVCAVQYAATEASHRMAIAPEQPNAVTISKNAEAYLKARDVRFAP